MDQRTTQQIITQIIGNTTFTWSDRTPLEFEAVTRYSIGEPEYPQKFDLSQLTSGFEESFLLGLKDLIMQRHLKVRVASMKGAYTKVLRLFKKIQSDQTSTDLNHRLIEADRISAIDPGLMLAVRTRLAQDAGWISRRCIDNLSDWFLYGGNGTVFKDLERGDFPVTDQSGAADFYRQQIIAKALSRTLQIAVLTDVERRFQVGEIHLGVYVLWNLTNTLYARPESLRQIRCGDLTFAENKATGEIQYTVWVMPAKRAGQRMPYLLTPILGQMLVKQQAWVIKNVGPLYGLTPDLDPKQRTAIEQQLALFPRIIGGTRKAFEIKHFGMLQDGADCSINYLWPIQSGLDNINVNFNVMRHTIGTQLAAAGVSAAVIQAVLRHATDRTARVYIDLAAKELREALNNGLEALEELFPAYNAFMNAAQTRAMGQQFPERVVNSRGPIDPATGEVDVQTTGGCGKTAACAFAPLSCYGCWRWIANIDADHSVNLRMVQARIKENEAFGKPMRTIVERDQLLEKVIELRMGQFQKHKAVQAQLEGPLTGENQ
jgi:hypothetical protein